MFQLPCTEGNPCIPPKLNHFHTPNPLHHLQKCLLNHPTNLGSIWSNLIFATNHKGIETINLTTTTNAIEGDPTETNQKTPHRNINRIGITLFLHHLNNERTIPIPNHHEIGKIFKPITHVPCVACLAITLIFVHTSMRLKGLKINNIIIMYPILLGIPSITCPILILPLLFSKPLPTTRDDCASTRGTIYLLKSRSNIPHHFHEWN